MPRVNFVTYVTDQYGVGYTGATVTILPRYYATPINAYLLSTGTTKIATPIQTVNGKAQFWLDDSIGYNITVTGTGFQDYTTYFDAISAESFNTIRTQFNAIAFSAFQGYATPVLGVQVDNAKRATYATPIVGVSMDFAKRATYATPIGQTFAGYATPILGTVIDKAGRADYATPIVGVTMDFAKRASLATPLPGSSIDFAGRATYATPTGIPYPSIDYINQNATLSGLKTFTTPVNIQSAGVFPSLNVTGLITATPGIRFSDGTVQTTGAGANISTQSGALALSTPIALWRSSISPLFFSGVTAAGFSAPANRIIGSIMRLNAGEVISNIGSMTSLSGPGKSLNPFYYCIYDKNGRLKAQSVSTPLSHYAAGPPFPPAVNLAVSPSWTVTTTDDYYVCLYGHPTAGATNAQVAAYTTMAQAPGGISQDWYGTAYPMTTCTPIQGGPSTAPAIITIKNLSADAANWNLSLAAMPGLWVSDG